MKFNHYVMEDALEYLIDYRGKTPKKSETGIETLSAKSVKNGYIDYSECYYISEEEYKRFMVRGLPQKGDILLTTEAPMGCVAKLDRDDVGLAQRLITLHGKDGVLDNNFLMYYLQSPIGQQKLKERETGTTVTGIKQAEFRKIEIDIPDIDVQKKIAGILQIMDEKINANKILIDKLQEEIQLLCNMWIYQYIPFGGEVPKDWENTSLADIADFFGGYSYKGNELMESNIAMATIKNFGRYGGFKLDGFKEIRPSSKLKENQHAQVFDLMVAHTDLTQNADVIGNAEMIMSMAGYDDIVYSMDVVKVVSKSDFSQFVIAAILQNKRFKKHCMGYVNGTTVLHLSKKALPDYEIILPKDASVLKPFDEAVTAIYKQISSIIDENIMMKDLKDTMLPKLLSGKVDVSELDI